MQRCHIGAIPAVCSLGVSWFISLTGCAWLRWSYAGELYSSLYLYCCCISSGLRYPYSTCKSFQWHSSPLLAPVYLQLAENNKQLHHACSTTFDIFMQLQHKINEDEEENWEFHSTHPTEETLCFTVAGFNLQRICKWHPFSELLLILSSGICLCASLNVRTRTVVCLNVKEKIHNWLVLHLCWVFSKHQCGVPLRLRMSYTSFCTEAPAVLEEKKLSMIVISGCRPWGETRGWSLLNPSTHATISGSSTHQGHCIQFWVLWGIQFLLVLH